MCWVADVSASSRGSLGGRSCELETPAFLTVPPVLDGARRSASEGSTQAAATAGRAGHARVRGRRCRLWERRQRFVGRRRRRRRRQRQGGRRNHADRDEVRCRHRGEGDRDTDQGRFASRPRSRASTSPTAPTPPQRTSSASTTTAASRAIRSTSSSRSTARTRSRSDRSRRSSRRTTRSRRSSAGFSILDCPVNHKYYEQNGFYADRGRRPERVLQHAEHRRAEHGAAVLEPRSRALRDRPGQGQGDDGRRLAEAARQRGRQPGRPRPTPRRRV